ncbi:hypothetical protein ACFL6Y_08135, partial [Elusimicrobiota bacterium]
MSSDGTTAYLAFIDANGDLAFHRRTGDGTWEAEGDADDPIEIDSNGEVAAPFKYPSIAYVRETHPSYCDMVYIIYTSTQGDSLYYAYGPATATAAGEFTIVKDWNTDATSVGYPNTVVNVISPYPLPVLYEAGSPPLLKLDFIPVSQYVAPGVSSVTVIPDQAWLTQQTFDILIQGNDFLQLSGSVNPAVSIMLNETESQDAINVVPDSVVFHTASSMTATLQLDPDTASSAAAYDVKVVNPDSKYDIKLDTINIPAPAYTAFIDEDGDKSSGGIFFNNPGTDTCELYTPGETYCVTRDITVNGSNFQYWADTRAVTLDLGDSGVYVSTISNWTTSSFTARLKISTQATVGSHDIRVVNADGQTTGWETSTFTVTEPLQGYIYPLSGYVTGFSQINGTAGMDVDPLGGDGSDDNPFPALIDGTTQQDTQLSIECDAGCGGDNGEFWTGSGWQVAANEEAKWFSITGSTHPWIYTNANFMNDTVQASAREFKIRVRARTTDEGRGTPTSEQLMIIDRDYPVPDIVTPPSNSIVKSQDTVEINSDDGSGIGTSKMELLVMQTDAAKEDGYSWTGSSWSDVQGLEIWLSTDSADGGDPDTIFATPVQTLVPAIFSDDTSIKRPAWVNGEQYLVQTRVTDGLDNTALTDENFRFMFDMIRPTVTFSEPSKSTTSTTEADAPWLRYEDLEEISGTFAENIQEDMNFGSGKFAIFIRVTRLTGGAMYLNPDNLLDGFTVSKASAAWIKVEPPIGAAWTLDTSVVDWDTGSYYKIEIYGRDTAKNWHGGDDGQPSGESDLTDDAPNDPPVFTRYFRCDNEDPFIGISYPDEGYYGSNFLEQITGTACETSTCLDLNRAGISSATFYVRYEGELGNKHWDVVQSTWVDDAVENVGWSTTTLAVTIATWTITDIGWEREGQTGGHSYYFAGFAKDHAGNISISSAVLNFGYDINAPTSTVQYPPNYSFSGRLPQISGTVQDLPEIGIPSGIDRVRIGIRRTSDGWWWNEDNWVADRDDWIGSLSGDSWYYDPLPDKFYNDLPAGSNTFEVYVHAKDKAYRPAESGDAEPIKDEYRNTASSSAYSSIFRYDIEKPTSTIFAPVELEWYSNVSGFDLPKILGTAVDWPLSGAGSGGLISAAQVRIQDLAENEETGCWNGTAFAVDCADDSVSFKGMGSPVASSYTYNATSGDMWAQFINGRTYTVTMRAKDDAYNNAFPTPVSIDSSKNIESNFLVSRNNQRSFKIDKNAPTAKITSLSHGGSYAASAFSSIAGTAGDDGSGFAVAVSTKMQIAYFEDEVDSGNGTCSGEAQKFWNPATSAFDIGVAGDKDSPIASAWIDVSAFDGDDWTATDAATPTFRSNCDYDIYVKAIDNTGNETAIAAAASNSNRITIYITGVQPVSAITLPAENEDHHRKDSGAGQLTTISGTASNSESVLFQIIVTTADTKLPGEGGQEDDDMYWNRWNYGSEDGQWVSVSTFVCVDVDFGTGEISSYTFPSPSANWRDMDRYKVISKAYESDDCTGASETPGDAQTRIFVIDDIDPTVALTQPLSGTNNTDVILMGTANETVEGIKIGGFESIKFKIVSSSTSDSWNGSEYQVAEYWFDYESEDSGVYSCSTETYVTAGSPWLNGKTFEVHIEATDKSGNTGTASDTEVTVDTVTPTGYIMNPASNTSFSSLTLITGTLNDEDLDDSGGDWFASNVSTVTLYLFNKNGLYFNEVGFAASIPTPLYAEVHTDTWSYTHANLNSAHSLSGTTYYMWVGYRDWGENSDTNYSIPGSSRPYWIDKSAPVLDFTEPSANAYTPANMNINGIAGTAEDCPGPNGDCGLTGINAGLSIDGIDVQIYFYDLISDATYYWDEYAAPDSTWTVVETSITVPDDGADTNWIANSDDFPTVAEWIWKGDQTFKVRARSKDKAKQYDGTTNSNQSAWTSETIVIVDNTPPISSVTVPYPLFVNSLDQIAGTAIASLAGGATVEVRIVELNDFDDGIEVNEWDPDAAATWVAVGGAPIWSTGVVTDAGAGSDSTATWTFSSLPSWTDDKRYKVCSRMRDFAGQLETSPVCKFFRFDGSSSTARFTLPDDAASGTPELSNKSLYSEVKSTRSITTTGGDFYIYGNFTETGDNASGISEVWVAIASAPEPTDRRWWNEPTDSFTLVQTSINWTQAAIHQTSFSYTNSDLDNALINGITYKVWVKVKDNAGNMFAWITNPGQGGEEATEFLYDADRPVSSISSPAGGGYANAGLTELVGTASEPNESIGYSDVVRVRVAVKRMAGAGGVRWWKWTDKDYTIAPDTPDWTDADWQQPTWSTPVVTSPIPMFVTGSTYAVVVRAMDGVTSEEQDSVSEGVQFLYDAVSPTTTITRPVANTRYRQLVSISGTFLEEVSGINEVQVVIQSYGTLFWDEGASAFTTPFNASNHWNDAADGVEVFASSWSFATPESYLDSGGTYYISVRAKDNAGNWNRGDTQPTKPESIDFLWDEDQPISKTTTPANNSAYNYLYSTVYGTARDCPNTPQDDCASPGTSAGIRNSVNSGIKLRINRSGAGDGEYLTGLGGWGTGETETNYPFSVTYTLGSQTNNQNWSWSDSPSSFEKGYRYRAISRALDETQDSGFVYTNYENNVTTNSWVIDLTSPSITGITVPADGGFVMSITTFTGLANDFSPDPPYRHYEAGLGTYTALQSIQVAFRRLSDGQWWDGTDFNTGGEDPSYNYGITTNTYNDGTSLMGVSSGTWEYYIDPSKLVNNTSYYLEVKAKDLAGNLETNLAEGGVNKSTFTVDTSTPTAVVGWPNEDVDCPSSGDCYSFQYLTDLSPSTGTASDIPIGQVDVVSLRFLKDADGDPDGWALTACWDGAAWQTSGCGNGIWIDSGTVSPANCTSGCTWSYTIPAGFPENNKVFRMTAIAKDKAGNIHGGSLPDATTFHWQFKFDAPSPVTGISNLSDLERIKPDQLDQIAGTSLNSVKTQVRIVRLSDDMAWDQDTAPSTGAWVAGPNYWNVDIDTGAGEAW